MIMEENRDMNIDINANINMQNDSCCLLDKSNECNDNHMKKEDLLKQIKCLRFAVIELALYLDTHPDDTKALCLHNKYTKELKELCDKYQKIYGPLTIEYPCNKWRWLESPWPWEGGRN